MNYKKDVINLFLYELQSLSNIHKIDQKQVYLQLINYGIPKEEQLKTMDDLLSLMLLKKYYYNKKVVVNNYKQRDIIKSKYKKENNDQYQIKIHVPLKINNIENTVIKIIDFILKNKIEFKTKVPKTLMNGIMVIEVKNKNDTDKITGFINNNKELSYNLYQVNPFLPCDEKVNLTIKSSLSYTEILSKYIYNYIVLCNTNQKEAEIEGLIQYLYSHIVDFISKNDLSKQIKIIDEKELKPEYLQELEEITKLIHSNLQKIRDDKNQKEAFYEQYEETNISSHSHEEQNNYKNINKESFEKDSILLKEIISTMTHIYGYNYTKQAIQGYKASGKTSNNTMNIGSEASKYITEKNGLREKVEKSKTFRTYINLFSEEELEKEFERLKPQLDKEQKEKIKTQQEMILEQVCKETYLSFQKEERGNSGRIQVAISLIRMQNNNYESITRKNNAREIAQNYLKPEEIVKIIKKSLETNGYIIENEEDLYELYATHIEHICNRNVGKGRK